MVLATVSDELDQGTVPMQLKEMMPITIILADDHRIVRQGVRALLQRKTHLKVVAEAETGAEAVRQAELLMPDVVVMDLQMPDLNGIEATRQIVAKCPRTKIIGLSGYAHVASGTAMLRAGASGYVFKDAAVDELVDAITRVTAGEIYVSPSMTDAIMTDYVGREGTGRSESLLSPREQEVLCLVAGGRSTKQAARELSVSVKTIETHRRNLMDKLQIDNVADLTKYAIRHGMCGL